ncbi:MAG: hypothetical protein K0Q92_2174 [Steroidobacteraceae bacterium]|nr:hypothetical protein [Steroidobacteraceae bacterium]
MSESSRVHALGARLKRLVSLDDLGITSRLVLALLSVAILAAAANLIVENGVTIVQMVAHGPSSEEKERAESRALAAKLTLALGQLDRAVRAQAEGAPRAANAIDSARKEMALAAEAFQASRSAPDIEEEALLDAVRMHGRDSSALVQAARVRRAAVDGYSNTLSSMSSRVQASIDRAWKIMGRVVARQSLLKLSAQLDDIQTAFALRDATRPLNGLVTRLAEAERAFADTLQRNADALRRSQGEEWLSGLRGDLAKLQASRERLSQADRRKTQLTQAFFAQSEKLVNTLSEATIGAVPAKSAAALLLEEPPAIESSAATSSPAVSTSASIPRRPLVAWLSLIVLAVLAYICTVTILSVVRQMRRLMEATRQLSRGEEVRPVAAGGIPELDALGSAFNSMARQLAAARLADLEAQRRLEGKVEERTRDLKDLAEKDPLTGLSNRRQLFAALDASIERARESGSKLGAFFLDIDNFKTINDSMGHAYGDRVLVEIARRLEATARAFGFAARLGGDEFMIVHEQASSIDEIHASGNALVHAFDGPIQIEGRELIVSVSVGASVYPDHERDAEALLRAADAAVFNAKELGRSRLTLFTPELLERATAKFAIEQRLRRAIEKKEFELFYQPEVNVQTLEVSVVEALIRWRMPDGGYQCPGEFLAVAEESGLIIEINDWVLNTAVETAARWHHGPWPEARVAINVSPRQFLDHRFIGKLRDLLANYRLPARCLELELTESLLQTGPAVIDALNELRAMGVAIALDDFGTGYSSIASLEQLPLTRVKLDRSLIARMDSSARSASIARATIGLCTELGLEVTAEGVERIEQFSALLGFGPISLQGYLLARPICGELLLASLKRVPAHCQELVLTSKALPAAPLTSVGALSAVPCASPASAQTRSLPPRTP